MLKKITKIIIIFISIFFICSFVFATQVQDVKDELDMDEMIATLKEYVDDDIDIQILADQMLNKEGADYGIIGKFLLNKLLYEIRVGIKACITILIVVILMAIVKGIELEKDSSVSKVTSLVGLFSIVSIILKSYYSLINVFLDTITTLTSIMEIISPFMLAILMATGEITTSGIIGPVLLFITSLIGTLVSFVILPLLNASLVLKILSNMVERTNVNKLSKICSSLSMWIIGVVFACFLGVMELESTVTTSIDSVAIKTSQAAVSNLVPVVGKFVSDSLEVVLGASEVIGKTVGVIGIIVILITGLVPVIKILIFSIMYYILSAICELLNTDDKITNLCEAMSKQYKTMLGIMIGVMITFVIGIGIVINLMGKVAS